MKDVRCAIPGCAPNKFTRPRLFAQEIDNIFGEIIVMATSDVKEYEKFKLRLDTKCPSCKKFNSIVIE